MKRKFHEDISKIIPYLKMMRFKENNIDIKLEVKEKYTKNGLQGWAI